MFQKIPLLLSACLFASQSVMATDNYRKDGKQNEHIQLKRVRMNDKLSRQQEPQCPLLLYSCLQTIKNKKRIEIKGNQDVDLNLPRDKKELSFVEVFCRLILFTQALQAGYGKVCYLNERPTRLNHTKILDNVIGLENYTPPWMFPFQNLEAGKLQFRNTGAFILDKYEESRLQGKKLGVFMLETHSSLGCGFQEQKILRLGKEMDLKSLYFESDPKDLFVIEQTAKWQKDPKSVDVDSKRMEAALKTASVLDQKQFSFAYEADRLDYKMKALEKEGIGKEIFYWGEECKIAADIKFKNSGKESDENEDKFQDALWDKKLKTDFSWEETLKICTDFYIRDWQMSEPLNQENESFFAVLGAFHLGPVHERRKRDDFLDVYVSCRNPEDDKVFDGLHDEYRQNFGRAYGDELLARFNTYEKDQRFYKTSDLVYQSYIPDTPVRPSILVEKPQSQ